MLGDFIDRGLPLPMSTGTYGQSVVHKQSGLPHFIAARSRIEKLTSGI